MYLSKSSCPTGLLHTSKFPVIIWLTRKSLPAKHVSLSLIYHSGKSIDYMIFKEIINFEPYLLLLNKNHRSIFTHYRTNHRLPIEVGRWKNIPRSERKYYLCDDDVIGDEYHFLFEC